MLNLIIKLYSSEKYLLTYFINIIINLSNTYSFKYNGPISLPLHIKLFNILKSPNGDKDARLQIKYITYCKFIVINNVTKSLVKKIMNINISPLVLVKVYFK